jgi:diphthamide synthase (EF-2-diphthine--ammonia ligase)
LSIDMLDELARLGVDPCGERGEYHTLVTNSPLFRQRLDVRRRGQVLRSACWALDVELAPHDAARR